MAELWLAQLSFFLSDILRLPSSQHTGIVGQQLPLLLLLHQCLLYLVGGQRGAQGAQQDCGQGEQPPANVG